MNMHATTPFMTTAEARARRIVHRTRGNSHGPITRLASPSDVGQLIKPFVFLDYFEIDPDRMPAIGWHPHSGIATLSLIFEGQITYEETSGTKGIIEPGGVEWMRAGGGVWHTGGAVGTARVKGYQLWVALPPEMESMEYEALEDAGFILGSAVKHPHDLAIGNYSVHKSQLALDRGERKITEIGKRLRAEGRI